MSKPRLLLCTDMDRTIIPNGEQMEHSMARKRFNAFCHQDEVTLVYVTGRHLKLAEQAIRDYQLPVPDYLATDVGTRIYDKKDCQWQPWLAWEREIDKDWNGRSSNDLKGLFSDITALRLQEYSKQNTHKLSYYVPLHVQPEPLLQLMQARLVKENIKCSLIWSVDEPKGVGLLDVLPENATKLHAIDFLRQQLGFGLDEVLFAGDSGNDLPVLRSHIRSVLVANAADEVKQAAKDQLISAHEGKLYIASGAWGEMNGNYAAGVLEGIAYFMPHFHSMLNTLGFDFSK